MRGEGERFRFGVEALVVLRKPGAGLGAFLLKRWLPMLTMWRPWRSMPGLVNSLGKGK